MLIYQFVIALCLNRQIKTMKNPLIKNCKTGWQDDILNRTAHYIKLLNSRSTIDNRHPKQYHSLLSIRNIHGPRNKAMSITTNNLKLMHSILNIDQNYSRYALDNIHQKHNYKNTLKNKWKEKQKQQEITARNTSLHKKLIDIESDLCLNKLNQFDKQMNKYSKIIRSPIDHVTEMDRKFYNTYRQEVHRLKTSRIKLKLDDINQRGSKIRKGKRRRLLKMKEKIETPTQNQQLIKQPTFST